MLAAGFADPVRDAQATFRRVLEAFAQPGRIVEVGFEGPVPPGPMQPAGFALALTLLDFETPVWLDAALDIAEVTEALRFHCGCPLTDDPEVATFAFIGAPDAMPALDAFSPGTPAYPDRGATLVLQVEALTKGQAVRLTGPGIRDQAVLQISGLPAGFWDAWAENHGRFPQGVDLVLVAGARLVAIPRSIAVRA